MRNLPILSVTVFLLGGLGSGCVAAPNTSAQLSAQQPKAGTVRPRITSPSPKNSSSSPFLPGVSLPVFPGISPTATSSPTPAQIMPTTPTLPLVEVPTPGLKATKVNKSLAPPSSTIKRSKVVVEQTPPSAKKRLKLREN